MRLWAWLVAGLVVAVAVTLTDREAFYRPREPR